ncbi:MAG TPA: hypothetical protein VMT85_10695 [Thermoanaerobaculia bacterium]|nr:hypothetical protein [Thermoanaerobaculia bacterium]
MSRDAEHLQILSIFHHVAAVLVGLLSLLPSFHLAFGIMMISGELTEGEPIGEVIGWFLAVLAGLAMMAGLTFAVCLVVAGRALMQRRRYTFCLVVAGLSCILVPFGTVLGVFSIVVLVRPSVRELFEEGFVGPKRTPKPEI